ncbi:MAG: glycosyltransferase [Bacteroidota bacterium]|nr:glycosyltransferase [Bacteroidota bacterium]
MPADSILGLVSFSVFPAEMGGQKGVVDFYTYLAQYRKVGLAVYKKEEPPTNLPFKVLPLLDHHTRFITNLRYIGKLAKLIKKEKISYLLIEHSYLGWMGLLLRRLTGIPYHIHSHNIETQRFRDMQKPLWQLYGWYEKRIHQRADHSYFITEEDRKWACKHWQLVEHKTSVVTYGTGCFNLPPREQKRLCREQILTENHLHPDTKLFLFNGTLDYLPNADAIRIIIHEIIPRLINAKQPFRILICGNRLEKKWEKALLSNPHILYKGFVPDIRFYLQGSDCFINPVTLGTGIKTKLVDALAENLTCISTMKGSSGISGHLTGEKLVRVKDYDWEAFTQAMKNLDPTTPIDTPDAFYQNFHWNTIIQQALLSLPAK